MANTETRPGLPSTISRSRTPLTKGAPRSPASTRSSWPPALLRLMVPPLMLLTGFQYWSTARTETVNGASACWVRGAPVLPLPDRAPGFGVSPGATIWMRLKPSASMRQVLLMPVMPVVSETWTKMSSARL